MEHQLIKHHSSRHVFEDCKEVDKHSLRCFRCVNWCGVTKSLRQTSKPRRPNLASLSWSVDIMVAITRCFFMGNVLAPGEELRDANPHFIHDVIMYRLAFDWDKVNTLRNNQGMTRAQYGRSHPIAVFSAALAAVANTHRTSQSSDSVFLAAFDREYYATNSGPDVEHRRHQATVAATRQRSDSARTASLASGSSVRARVTSNNTDDEDLRLLVDSRPDLAMPPPTSAPSSRQVRSRPPFRHQSPDWSDDEDLIAAAAAFEAG